jgi:hypothetical protein
MVDVVAIASTLRRSPKGSVTGQVFLRGPAGDFPEERWSDFPVVILGWWIEGLVRVVEGQERSFQGMFMDGPFAFVVHRGAGESGRLAWGRIGEETSIGIVDLRLLLRSATDAGRLVAGECRARGWESRDLEALERAISRSAV